MVLCWLCVKLTKLPEYMLKVAEGVCSRLMQCRASQLSARHFFTVLLTCDLGARVNHTHALR